MEGIVLRFDKETGQGLLRPMDMRPPRPCRFEAPNLKKKLSKGMAVYFDTEGFGPNLGIATNVRLEE